MKTALIVDDSRVARAVLRKTLVGFGIDVDEAPSAEAAIEYLRIDRPDVIFLDHLMPGMDGFDALGVLKANPRTATIPVMMYTAQEGQFYVSQARALGAVDVMPKSLAPADVERILRTHRLIGEPGRTPVEREGRPADDHHALIERFRTMLDEQAVMLMSDFRRELEYAQSASTTGLHRVLDELRPKPKRWFDPGLASASSLAALGVAVAVGFAYLAGGQSPGDVAGPASPAATGMAMSASAGVATVEALETAGSEALAVDVATERSWSFNLPYPYDASPLDDERAREFAPLFAELRSEGFTGIVTFDIHEGRYCMNYSADGSTVLAPPDQPAAACDYIGTQQSGAGAPPQSPMFANMVASAKRDGGMEIDTVPHGTDEPVMDYPQLDYYVTAGDWNAIADINHRISMRVRGEAVAGRAERVAQLAQ